LLTGKNKGGLKESLDAIAYQGLKESLDIEEATADQFAIYSPKAIEIGQRFCDQYGIDDPDEMQLVIELIDGQVDLAQSTNTPLDMNKIKSEVGKYFRMAYRGLRDPMPNFRKKFNEDDVEMKDQGEYDDEAGMARQDLHTVVDAAKELHDILASDENLPEWVQAKITKALDYIDTSRDYVKSSHADQGDEQEVTEFAPIVGAALRAAAPTASRALAASALGRAASSSVATATPSDMNKPSTATTSSSDSPEVYSPPNSSQEKTVDETGYSAKAARAGKDIGKPGKNFSKIAKGAAERYGSKAAGERVAGAVLNKLRHPTEEGASPDQLTQQKIAQMKRAAATRKNSRDVQQQPPIGGPRRSEVPAFIRKARGDAPLGRDEMEENSMGGTVAGGIAPAAGQKTFAEASSGSHEVTWKAAGKAVHAIMKQRGYAGSKTEEGYMWTKQTPKGTAFVDIDFDERDPDTARWGEGELKGAKNKSYYQSGNDNVSDLAQVIGQLFANVKAGQPAMDEADEDGKKAKSSFGKKKPDDDGDGVPDWADKKPGEDDNEESDSNESDESEEDDDKALKKMKSHAGIEDKDDEESDNKPQKGKKPDFGKKKDEESDDEDDSDDSDKESEDDDSEDDDSDDKKSEKKSEDKPKKDTSGTPYGKSVYESAYTKQLKRTLTEGISANASADDSGK